MNELWRKDVLVWVGAALAVGLNAAIGVYNVGHMRANERVLADASATQSLMTGVVSDMADAETGHRGYVITGRDDFLDPFRAAEPSVRDRVAVLRERLSNTPDQLSRLDEIERLTVAKYAEMRRVLDTRATAGPQAAADLIAVGEGKRVMDTLRRVGKEMAEVEELRLKVRAEEARAEFVTAEVTTVTGGVLAIVVIAFGAVFNRRELRRRERLGRVLVAAKADAERSLTQLDALVRNAPYMIAFYDDHLRFVRVNEALAAGTGLPVEAHFGKHLLDVRPDAPAETVAAFREVMAGGPPITASTVSARGRMFEVSAFQVPVDDDRMGLAVISQDVTEKHRAAEQVRESEGRFRQLAEAMPQIVWITRPDGYHEYYNARWYEFTGMSEEQSIGWGWSAPLHPDDAARSQARWKLATDTGEPYEIEYRFRRHDGVYEWFLGRAVAMRDEGGRVVRWLGTCTNIDEQVRTSQALQASETRLRAMAEAMPQIVWEAGADGAREYYNARWYQFTGLSDADSLGQGKWVDALHPDDRQRGRDAWARSVATGEIYEIEYRFRRHDGVYEWFLGRAVPVRDEGGQIVRWYGTCTGIDEQVRTAQALQTSETRFRQLADAMPQIVFTATPDGAVDYYNGQWYEYTGFPNDGRTGDPSWEGVHEPESLDRVHHRWRQSLGSGEPYQIEYRLRRADGQFRWHLGRANPVRDADGRIVRWYGTNTDIHDQKQLEFELQEARRFTESVLHSLPGHLAVIEADGRVLSVNESWRQFGEANGLSAGFDWTESNYYEACRREEYGQRAEAGIRAVASGERGAFEMEYPCHGAGRERWFVLRANRFRGDGPVRLVITHENITDRVIAERRVREQASELRQLTEGLPVLMWACRPTGECDYLSRQWGEYTGRPVDDQLGYVWLDALHPDDRPPTETAWAAAVARGSGYDVEFRIRRHDGAYRWFAVRGFPVKDQSGEVMRWYGSCSDIDDRVRQEIFLEQIVEERTAALTRSNEELEKFAYIASHDLQEPLRKIQAFGSRLADRFRPGLGDQGKDYIDRMLDSAGRMRRLIEDLLAFSRVNTKGAPFVSTDLNRVVREVLEDLEDQLVRTGGQVRADDLPTVTGDTSQLRQVFQNLIGNALKFARPDVPPVVKVTIVPFDRLPADTAPPAGRGWRITVADNGIGFDSQYAERIFELFQRLHGRGEYEGTGLGLAIVRKIVLRHGATITAHSRPGEGAEFVIDWPMPAADSSPDLQR